MNTKAEQVAEIIKILKNESEINYNSDEGKLNGIYDFDEKYDKINFWEDISPFFSDLENVTHFTFENHEHSPVTIDIYSKLAKLINLRRLFFRFVDLSGTEEYINNGFKVIPKLEELQLVGTKLNHFPKSILDIETLSSIAGNKFYKQNFHFEFINTKDISNREKICNRILDKIQENVHSINDVWVQGYKWKNEEEPQVLIMRDNFVNDYSSIFSISVYVLNENNRYGTFKTFYNLFKKINDTEKCFKTINETNELDIFFYHEDVFYDNEIELRELKERYKSRVDKYKGYIVEDLIKYLGGRELLLDIRNEQSKTEKHLSKEFYKKNSYIDNISIKNFKIFDNKQQIDGLSDINVIIGKNAQGKTSLLQAIAASLIPKLSDDISSPKNYININSYNNSEKDDYAETTVEWNGGYNKTQRITDRGIVLVSDNELPVSYLVLAYGENLYAKQKPYSSYQDILKTGSFKSYHTKGIFNTTYEKMINPLDLLYELSEGQIKEANNKYKKELLEIGELIKNKINVFLNASEARSFELKKDGAYFKFYDKEKKQYLDIEQISEGYRSYIILLTDIIFHIIAARKDLLVNSYTLNNIFAKVKGTILIDEFDKHMHPTWQRTFLSSLRKEFPLIQFFLSTHNIIALQSAEKEKVLIVENNNINIKVIELGFSIESIYKEFFDKENNLFGEKTKKLYEEFKHRLYEISFEEIDTDVELQKTISELTSSSHEMNVIIQGEIGQSRIKRKNATTK